MANIKSAKKRVLIAEKKATRNQAVKSRVKTEIKKVLAACEAGNKEDAQKLLRSATGEIEKAGSKGVLPKNTVSRKVSRLSKKVAAL